MYITNILDNFKSLLFGFHTLGFRRTIDVLDSETNPDPFKFGPDSDSDPGLYGLQGTADTKSMKTKKKVYKIIYNIHSVDFFLRYRALDPVFG